MQEVKWSDKYDKSVSAVVREVLTILEGFFLESEQRTALRKLIRKSIYGIMDDLKVVLVDEFGSEDGCACGGNCKCSDE